jgi:hypothetical protein
MKFKSLIIAVLGVTLSCTQVLAQASILPPGETCFSALAPTSGGPSNTGTGFIGLLGSITGGSSYVNGTYGGVPLTGGSGANATANITVSGGIVTQVAILNPGVTYVAGDVLSASAANLGGSGSGFSVPVSSVSLNYALAGGSVGFYVPNTLTIKQTWQDSGETTLNQNPVPLDANGCAVIYGAGIYRMIVQDSLGNTVYDKLTTAPSGGGLFWAGLAGGTGNAITVTDTAFALQDGYALQFRAIASNTGPATIAVSGGAPIAVVIDTTSGPAALSGAEIDTFNQPIVSYDATNVEFHLVNPAVTTSSSGSSGTLTPPQGYLNLAGQSSGSVVQTADAIGVAVVYYSPYVGNTIPVWNGSTFKTLTFTELTATLTSSGSASNAIQDACVFSNNGVPTLAIGPAWTTPTAGSGNRGTGAGTAQLSRLNGIWVNAVSITGYNGLSSYTIAANQCTYVGSLSIDATAGQVSAYVTWGQSRKWGVWNAYNRQTITVQAGDSTSSWTNTPTTWRQSHANANDYASAFMGLPEETVRVSFVQNVNGSCSTGVNLSSQIGIGINSTTSPTGQIGQLACGSGAAAGNASGNLVANTPVVPVLGINQYNMLEQAPAGTTNNTFNGGNANMVLTLQWRG